MMSFVESDIPRLMAEALIPGAAVAVIRDNALERVVCFGQRHADADARVDENTVFEAASLTKPVFAYVALRLVDQGRFSLTMPLGDYLPRYLPGDARAATVTLADVLSHSAGFPNWRNGDFPLRTYFAAGERFSYSGEGYLYAQHAIEAATGASIEVLCRELVFEPLAMARSSLIWNAALERNRAFPHDAFGRPALGHKPGEANVAWTLQTSASDYARFLIAVLEGKGLKAETTALWLQPRVEVRHKGIQALDPPDADMRTGVAWGLGWGLELDTRRFFHWGNNGPFTAFTLGSITRRDAVAVFTNSASGLSIMRQLVGPFVAGDRPSLAWLDYVVTHDAPVRRMLRAARADGVAAIWTEVESGTVEKDDLTWIAQGLLAAGREADAARLRAYIKGAASIS
jgi:CubicO group peptidase (beta-lactamase class C family)